MKSPSQRAEELVNELYRHEDPYKPVHNRYNLLRVARHVLVEEGKRVRDAIEHLDYLDKVKTPGLRTDFGTQEVIYISKEEVRKLLQELLEG